MHWAFPHLMLCESSWPYVVCHHSDNTQEDQLEEGKVFPSPSERFWSMVTAPMVTAPMVRQSIMARRVCGIELLSPWHPKRKEKGERLLFYYILQSTHR